MTLVVARRVGTTVHVLADCLVSGGRQDLRNEDLALKVLLADQRTIIGYSGSPEIAHKIIQSVIHSHANSSFAALAAFLWEQIGTSTLEFIVVRGTEIARLRSGKCECDLSVAWIGDHSGFSLYQEYLDRRIRERTTVAASNLAAEDLLQLSELRGAMEDVVRDPYVLGVGGPIVSATSGPGGAKYDCLMTLASPRGQTTPLPQNEWTAVDFGNAAKGGYGFTTIVPVDPGISGWGVFYFQAFAGTYLAADFSKFEFTQFGAKARSVDAFCRALESEVGYKVQMCAQLRISDAQ